MDFRTCDEWMPLIELPLTKEQFHRLPRNPAYKYELIEGKVLLSPRPKFFHAVLGLGANVEVEIPRGVSLRALHADDWPRLAEVFAGAFTRLQPYGSLDDATRGQAARQSLERTRLGGDGPLVEAASFVAVEKADERVSGAILITLLPEGDPSGWDSYEWGEPPPDDLVARHAGRAHLTWIFVSPWEAGRGVGSALLRSAAHALRQLGYTQLFSTFLLGNDSSLLWHWRNGFRLLPSPASRRRRQP